MIGGNSNSQHQRLDGVLDPYLSTLSEFGASREAIAGRYASNPWIIGEGINGKVASIDNYGAGLLSVANKPSEVNILNIPIVYVQYQLPNSMKALQTGRLLSRGIPLKASLPR